MIYDLKKKCFFWPLNIENGLSKFIYKKAYLLITAIIFKILLFLKNNFIKNKKGLQQKDQRAGNSQVLQEGQ